ncbi:MAG: SdpI family protein [Gemmatimonadaceae bacterium]
MRNWYRWYPIAITAAAAAISAAVYRGLPPRVPIHWNIRGQADGFGSPLLAVSIMPLIMLTIALLIPLLPRIDPRRANYDKFFPTYYFAMNASLTVMFAIHCAVLAATLGYPVPVGRIVPAAIALLFIALGNVLPRARANWWFGIRTPWTLSNDRVWARTHRFGGRLMTFAGVVMLAAALLLPQTPATSALVPVLAVGTVLASLVYSYIAWREEQ